MPAPRCIHQLFEECAARTPERVALVFESQQLTYRELDARANQIANRLRREGVGPEVLVGLCLERGLELVVGLLGILKAGGAYVPIDPQYPPDRRRFMLDDSAAAIVLSQQSLQADFAGSQARVICLDDVSSEIAHESTEHCANLSAPENLAYVIYTSGSTGQPKGTLIPHRNVTRLFTATLAWFGFSERDVWTLFHSCAFDFSVWEIWGALLFGGRLVIVPFEISRTPERFYRLLQAQQVTVLNQTPSAFRQLMAADQAASERRELALRLVIFGGEALDFHALEPWFKRHGEVRPQLVNMYGITETTVHVTYRPIGQADVASASVIGVAIPDLDIYLLDPHGNRVANGVEGEIYVGGPGVARGYLNRPDLTAQKFVSIPAVTGSGERLYRSGDSARYLPNGDLEYLGRIDSQVKIRGFRIELGEIAAALHRHPAIADCAVVVRNDASGEKTLAAYLVRRGSIAVDAAALRVMLRAALPEYMVPAHFTFVPGLPLTVNGKLDTGALPAPDSAKPAVAAFENLDGTPLEREIGRVWIEVLGLPSLQPDQNFFDVGGNSMNLVQIHTRLQALLGRQFGITELFAHATVRALARHFGSAPQPPGSTTGGNDAQTRAALQRQAFAARRAVKAAP